VRYAPNATPLITLRSTNPNAPTFKVIANTPGMTSAALTVALQTTHVTMPNFVVKGDALQNIIAYFLSLKEKNCTDLRVASAKASGARIRARV
jgi:hypothetical protein